MLAPFLDRPRCVGSPKHRVENAVAGNAREAKVIEYHSPVHQCATCGVTFMPERYTRLAKHTHNLMSWLIFELCISSYKFTDPTGYVKRILRH